MPDIEIFDFEKGAIVTFLEDNSPGSDNESSKKAFGFVDSVQLISAGNFNLNISLPNGKKRIFESKQVNIKSVKNMDVPDLLTLDEVEEKNVMLSLFSRFKKALVYTYIGSILISTNPFRDTKIYDSEVVRSYRNGHTKELPPHIFAVAKNAINNLKRTDKNQCILISGESGAGKTESTKFILQFLVISNGTHGLIEDSVVMSNTVLEAFGNAKTVRNNNSSRFGKFIEVRFDSNCAMVGANINEYLLEKSRIVHQEHNERNYHSFYYLVSGGSSYLKEKFNLTRAEDFHYLNQSGCMTIDGVNDSLEFNSLCDALKGLQFSREEIENIFSILAIVLHLGNIKFTAKTDNEDACCILDQSTIKFIASLFKIASKDLESILTTRSSVTRGEKFVTPYSVKQAENNRDACAKAMYGALFKWIVKSINQKVHVTSFSNYIGILDIFGFEIFALCINYCNERLHKFLNDHIFKLEQELYKVEGIPWVNISYDDNQNCLDLISKKPIGILHLLNEECNFPKATDKTLLDKINNSHDKHPSFLKSKMSGPNFTILHYAGKVTYDVEGFLEKNRDTISQDVQVVMHHAEFSFISAILSVDQAESELRKSTLNVKGTITKKTSVSTVSEKFDESLQYLMANLSTCNPHFVQCVKPNSIRSPEIYDTDMVISQLRYAGIMETINMRKSGYGSQKTFKEFVERYYMMLKIKERSKNNLEKDCSSILNAVLPGNTKSWCKGKTKIFLKDGVETLFEIKRNEIMKKSIEVLESWFFTWAERERFKKSKAYIIRIQRVTRGWLHRLQAKRRKLAAIKVQTQIRFHLINWKLAKLRRANQVIQSGIKTFLSIDMAGKIISKMLATVNDESSTTIEEEVKGVNTIIHFAGNSDASIYSSMEVYISNLIDDEDNGKPISIDNLDTFNSFVNQFWINNNDRTYNEMPLALPLLARLQESAKIDEIMAIDKCILGIVSSYSFGGKRIPKSLLLSYLLEFGADQDDYATEIYAQLMKKINGSPSFIRRLLYHILLVVFLYCGTRQPFMVSLIADVIKSSNDEYLVKCAESLHLEIPRKRAISQTELEALLDNQKSVVSINFGKNTTLIETYPCYQIFDVLVASIRDLEIKNGSGFALKSDPLDKEFLDPQELLLDTRFKDPKQPKLYLKKQFFYPLDSFTSEEQDHIFDQLLEDFAIFSPCPETEAFKKYMLDKKSHPEYKLGLIKHAAYIPNYFFREFEIEDLQLQDDKIVHTSALIRISFSNFAFFQRSGKAISEISFEPIKSIELESETKASLTIIIKLANGSCKFKSEADSDLFETLMEMYRQIFQANKWFISLEDRLETSSNMLKELTMSAGDKVYMLGKRDDINWINGYIPDKNVNGWISADLLRPNPDIHVLLDPEVISEALKTQLEETKLQSSAISIDQSGFEDNDDNDDNKVNEINEIKEINEVNEDNNENIPNNANSSFKFEDIPESFPIKVSTYVPPDQIQYDDKKYDFINWAREKFALKEKKKGISFFDVDEAVKATTFSKHPIKTSLNSFTTEDATTLAVDVFACIMIYMGDLPGIENYSQYDLTMKLITIGNQNKTMKDEIFCQVMKQVTGNNNTKTTSLRRGWELMEMFCGTFSPSLDFYPYLLHFLLVSVPSRKNTTAEISRLSKKCGNMVKALTRAGARLQPPNITEWENIVEHRPQVIEVHFPDKSSKKIEIQVTDKVRNLMQIISDKVFRHNPKEIDEYVLIISNPSHDILVPDHYYIMDVMTIFAKSYGRARETTSSFFPLNIKKIIWRHDVPVDSLSTISLNFMYHQIFNNMVHENWDKMRDVLVKVLVTQALDMDLSSITWSKVWDMVPSSLYNAVLDYGEAKLVPECNEALTQARLKPLDKLENKKGLLRLFEDSIIFGTNFYRIFNPVCDDFSDPMPDVVILGVNGKGIHLIDLTKRTLIRTYPIQDIVTWRSFFNIFTLSAGSMLRNRQINLKASTKFGDELCNIIEKHVQLLKTS